jgi:hypothetical protein
VTGGEDGHVAGEASPVLDQDAHAGTRNRDAPPLAVNDLEPPRRALRPEMRSYQLGDIAAIDAPLGEGQRAGLAPLRGRVMRREPAGEMRGIVGECAHVGRAHIEEMAGLRRRVSHAAADRIALLDERHADLVIVLAQQMAGEQYSARSAADDDEMFSGPFRQGNVLAALNSAPALLGSDAL